MVSNMRREHDTLGELDIPRDVYYGIQTMRAISNFPISNIKAHTQFIKAAVMVKKAAAEANINTGRLNPEIGEAIIKASDEIIGGRFNDQFVVDVFQAGAGTSHNMNTNEVIANRAIELLSGEKEKGNYTIVHPNDHVNMSQSTNDTFPTAMRVAALLMLKDFFSVLRELYNTLLSKGEEFDNVIKSGRTHLQDAVPIRLGQEFKGYGLSVKKSYNRIKNASHRLNILGIGGSAVGTGINTHPLYRSKVVESIRRESGLDLKESDDLIESTQSMGDFVEISSSLKALACELIRIANDLRLMSSGPKTGFNEIILPPVQPGSSIMPGKVNPVMAEVMNMVCFQVIGNDLTVTMAAQAGQLELNVMMPVINFNILSSIEILKNVINLFTEKCLQGIMVNKGRCNEFAEKTIGLATILNPYIGYEKAADVAKEAMRTGKSIREIVVEMSILSQDQIDNILDPFNMT